MALNATGTGAPVQKGEYIDFTPTYDVAAGRVVVIGNLVGIAPRPIAANTTGVVQIEGVVSLPKLTVTTGSENPVITAGAVVYFATGPSGVATSFVTGVKAGYAIAEAATAAATVLVKLER